MNRRTFLLGSAALASTALAPAAATQQPNAYMKHSNVGWSESAITIKVWDAAVVERAFLKHGPALGRAIHRGNQ